MLGTGSQETEVGSIVIDTGKVVTAFKEEKVNFSFENTPISDQLRLQYQLYVEKTKYNLDNSVKNVRGQSDTKKKENSIDSEVKKSSGKKQLTQSFDS